jgi:hypothetical protein
MKTVVRSAF